MPTPSPLNAVEIRAIQAQQTHTLRHFVLRPHQPMAEMAYPGDDDPETRHLGAFAQDNLIGVISLYLEPMPELSQPGDWRLRGMAVEPTLQGQGFGARLVDACLAAVKKSNGQRLWCNARTAACGFYERQGFHKSGDPFDLPGIGEHFVMWIAVDAPPR